MAGHLNIAAGNINMPASDITGTQGYITVAGSRFIGSYGNANTFIGDDAANLTLNPAVAIGNTSLGFQTTQGLTIGVANTAIGPQSLQLLMSGMANTVVGAASAPTLLTGNRNIVLGAACGTAYVNNESDNILINSVGVVAENGTIRIGRFGEQTRCFINGIDGVNVGAVSRVVVENAHQLGTAIITAGTDITVTPAAGTITIASSGTTTLAYTNVAVTLYVAIATDNYLSVDTSGLAITIRLPNAATLGRTYVIKDRIGDAATRNITVTTPGGAVLFDGVAAFVMNTAYQAVNVVGNGVSYEVF
jgi:hypothetical protein